MNKVIVLLSGGQDSTTCLFWAINKFKKENVYAIGFNYNQRHKIELDQAKKICKDLNIDYKIIDMKLLNQLTENALTRDNLNVNDTNNQNLPMTFVDGRNHIFLSFASIYAKQKGIKHIVTGVCETDFSGYPDCRDIFIKSLNVTLNLAMDYNFTIHTPLMWLNKKQTWDLAEKLNCMDIIIYKTVTCYNGVIGEGCGNCPSCKLRIKGYNEYVLSKEKN